MSTEDKKTPLKVRITYKVGNQNFVPVLIAVVTDGQNTETTPLTKDELEHVADILNNQTHLKTNL